MLTPKLVTVEKHVHTVPVALALQLVELLKRWHIPDVELLAGVGLGPKALEDPLARLPVTTMHELLEHARLLTAEPGLGYYLGLQKRVSLYGYLGFAALSAPSIRQALELAVKFAPIFSTALAIDLKIDGELAALRVEEQASLGSARDIVLISLMLGLQTIGFALTGQSTRRSIDFAMDEPPYHARFAHLTPNWRFGQPSTRLLLDTASLDAPIVTADPAALALARSLCERSLDELGFDAGLADRVRRLVASDTGGFRSLEHVAALVHLSPRTLKRRLAAQGISFSNVVDRERLERALVLLQSSRLPIEDVAQQLDYATASTFVRAFHRWTGTTPSAYRREKWYGARAG
ncbi:MAG: AraC family transcriptional regulator ligand-binding domain-containing protein [Polyangiaceae bacterium]